MIADFKLGTIFCLNYNLDRFISSIEIIDQKMSKELIMTLFGDKKGNMIVMRYYRGYFYHLFLYNIHNALITVIKANLKN